MPGKPKVFRPAWLPQYSTERERKALIDQGRPSAAERGYDAAWRKVRKQFLEANPRCCEPECGARSEQADHVLSVRDRPDLRLSWSNLRPYCTPHHSARTARDQGFGRRQGEGGYNL
jgi:5-methylcytosine-specific restriction protein A